MNRNRRTVAACTVVLSSAGALAAWSTGCGTNVPNNPTYGTVVDAAFFNPGTGAGGSGYGSGGNTGGGPTTPIDAGPPQCADSLKTCAETFTYPYGGETSVQLRGSYASGAWTAGASMTLVPADAGTGSFWSATVQVPWGQPVEYKFFLTEPDGGTVWTTSSANPTSPDDAGDLNNVAAATTCPNSYACSQPGALPADVFDWRDAVIYFVFVDRFFDGDPSNNCNVAGSSTAPDTSANYLGGDWAGVTQKINAGYFRTLGVNTLWITVPLQNATVTGAGVDCSTCTTAPCSCGTDGHEYSGYHGYWPTDPTQVESCFGTPADLQTLVTTAHANGLKILFDYAMVDIHTSSPIYTAHVNDSPSWFTGTTSSFCQCGAAGCSDYDDYVCWFAPYLAHFDFTHSSAARTYSVNAAVQLVQSYANDAFRLDAIKQVDPSWLAALRPQIATYETQVADGGAAQSFYMVGETYDFQNRALIKSLIAPGVQLDGQFDFPLRIRLVEAMLMRSTQNMLTPDDLNWGRTAPPGMQGLQEFMDSNDSFYTSSGPIPVVMSTFIGNHDLPRSIHYAEQTLPAWISSDSPQNPSAADGKNDAWTSEPATETDPNTYERLANAFAVILTNKGAPLIYYGDEIGQPGAGDPDNRRMMPWSGLSSAQQGLHDRIATLAAIRAAHPATRRGSRTTLYVNADLWVFSETATDANGVADTLYVAINRNDSDRTTTAIPSGLPELVVGGNKSTGNDTVPARETRIFSSYVPSTADAGADGG